MPKVIIYTTPTCPYCHLAKEFFQEHNVAFEEFNVAEDEQAREEMIKKLHKYIVSNLGEISEELQKPL